MRIYSGRIIVTTLWDAQCAQLHMPGCGMDTRLATIYYFYMFQTLIPTLKVHGLENLPSSGGYMEKIIEFIKRVGSDTLLFHGEDMLCMDPFMGSYGKEDEWRRYSKYRVNTGEFFKKVQREINFSKFKMSVITKQYGWPAVQALYEEGQHGALVDAEVLSMLCCGKMSSLRIRFGHWLSLARWID